MPKDGNAGLGVTNKLSLLLFFINCAFPFSYNLWELFVNLGEKIPCLENYLSGRCYSFQDEHTSIHHPTCDHTKYNLLITLNLDDELRENTSFNSSLQTGCQNTFHKEQGIQGWGCCSVVEFLPCMRPWV